MLAILMNPKILNIFILILLNSSLISVHGQTLKRDAFFAYEVNSNSKKTLRVNCYYHNDSVRTIVMDPNVKKVYDTFYDIKRSEIQYISHIKKRKLILTNVPRNLPLVWDAKIDSELVEIDDIYFRKASVNKSYFSFDYCTVLELPEYTKMAFHQLGIMAMEDEVITADAYSGLVKKVILNNDLSGNKTKLKLKDFIFAVPDSSFMISMFKYDTDTLDYTALLSTFSKFNADLKLVLLGVPKMSIGYSFPDGEVSDPLLNHLKTKMLGVGSIAGDFKMSDKGSQSQKTMIAFNNFLSTYIEEYF
ncbi:hypothetical protein C3K47_03475 [Solitalea longa]|uniref:Uncharacterized protein n=1 Tax=Solitalea longa TaxID=2079460 RepID=A0A2S5A7G8_9SPHI|nr:hypothetical protein [Solitalea longa]POY38466.1 hypothetical protein C3K47_03475 [Solitalea longa]